MNRTDRDYLADILDASRRLAEIVAQGRDRYDRSWVVRSAVERQLEIIGEAAGRLSEDLALRRPDLPLQQARAVRNRIVHDYLGIDPDTLWRTIVTSIPEFASKISDELGTGESEHRKDIADV